MTLHFEDHSSLERSSTWRWVSIIAVIIPVASFVLLAALFIRAYIVPPMVVIPSAMMTATATPPSAPFDPPVRAQAEAPKPQALAVAQPAAPQASQPTAPLQERPAPAAVLPMFSTLSAVPPSFASAPPVAFADPAPDVVSPAAPPAASPDVSVEPVAVEPGEPVEVSVPLPRSKPLMTVAALATTVPLPRPRPAEIAAPAVEPDLPVFDRHAVE